MTDRPPLPPFTRQTAATKVAAEDAWNTRDPEHVAGAYTEDSVIDESDRRIFGPRPEEERGIDIPPQ